MLENEFRDERHFVSNGVGESAPSPIRFAHRARVSVFCLVNNLNEGARGGTITSHRSASAARKSAARRILQYAEAVEIPIDPAARVGLFDKINPVFRLGSIVSGAPAGTRRPFIAILF